VGTQREYGNYFPAIAWSADFPDPDVILLLYLVALWLWSQICWPFTPICLHLFLLGLCDLDDN
jgi:hypothetical protein